MPPGRELPDDGIPTFTLSHIPLPRFESACLISTYFSEVKLVTGLAYDRSSNPIDYLPSVTSCSHPLPTRERAGIVLPALTHLR